MNRLNNKTPTTWSIHTIPSNRPFAYAYWYGTNKEENATYTPVCNYTIKEFTYPR